MKIETPVLRRLGPIPFWRGEKKCLDALETIYRKVRESADKCSTLPVGLIPSKCAISPIIRSGLRTDLV